MPLQSCYSPQPRVPRLTSLLCGLRISPKLAPLCAPARCANHDSGGLGQRTHGVLHSSQDVLTETRGTLDQSKKKSPDPEIAVTLHWSQNLCGGPIMFNISEYIHSSSMFKPTAHCHRPVANPFITPLMLPAPRPRLPCPPEGVGTWFIQSEAWMKHRFKCMFHLFECMRHPFAGIKTQVGAPSYCSEGVRSTCLGWFHC